MHMWVSVTVFPLVCWASLFQKGSKDSELCNLGPGPWLLLMVMTMICVFWRELRIWNRIQKQQAVDQNGPGANATPHCYSLPFSGLPLWLAS